MPLLARLKRDTYRDSVELMRLSAEVAARPGVRQFSAMMATPANLELLRAGGLLAEALDGARPNDLCLAAAAEDVATAEAALAAAEELLARRREVGEERPAAGLFQTAHSLRGALAARPALNLALISVPGEYAAAEARRALRAGLHVMLFSDNVPLEEEVALKQEADRLGLLCMGPDCGTALIGGVPLGFANRVRRGRVGLVAASGTGLQAVSCQIHQLGEGISHALGCGGRDLQAAVGGRATLAGLSALAADPGTAVLVVISKPGDAEVEGRVLARAAELGKPVVFHFLGRPEPPAVLPRGSAWAASLEETGRAAVALARGEAVWEAVDHAAAEREGREVAGSLRGGSLAGLFPGGTLAAEAAEILAETLGVRTGASEAKGKRKGSASHLRIASPADADPPGPGEMLRARDHVVVDLGDDAFTRGRPHPIIAPAARAGAIERTVADGASLLLLDVILGFGAHPDPAGALIPSVERAREVAARRGGRLEVLAGVVGTDLDPQPLGEQVARLRAGGVRVYDTPTMAARVAAHAAAVLGR